MAASLTAPDSMAMIADRRRTLAPVVRRSEATVPDGGPARGLTDELETAPISTNAPAFVRARIRASLATQYDPLMQQRNLLVHKQLETPLTPAEKAQLNFIKWQLDRIEDAEEGDYLDHLEKIAAQNELLASRIKDFSSKLEGASPTVFTPRNPKSRR